MIGLVLTIRYRQPLLLTGNIFVLIFIASLDGRQTLGVTIKTPFSPPPANPPSAVVLSSYSGRASLDAVLASGASSVRLVMDPIETRVAWFGLRESASYLKAVGASDAACALEPLLEEVGKQVPPKGSTIAVGWDEEVWRTGGWKYTTRLSIKGCAVGQKSKVRG
jgi:hypothetical protein